MARKLGMQDNLDVGWLDRFMQASQSAWPLAIVVLATTGRFLMLPPKQSVATWCRSFVLSMLAAFLAHNLARHYGLGENAWAFSVAVASFLADDILRGILVIGTTIRTNPTVVLDWLKPRGR